MTRLFLLFLVALVCAPAAFAQSNDYSHYEFYVGYAYERANNNADTFDKNGRTTFNGKSVTLDDRRENYNGFNAEFNQNLNRHVGIVTSFTATYNNGGYVRTRPRRAVGRPGHRQPLTVGPRRQRRPPGGPPVV